MELKSVPVELPEGCNIIIGHSHFIKTVEDLHEIMVGTSAQVKFGRAGLVTLCLYEHLIWTQLQVREL